MVYIDSKESILKQDHEAYILQSEEVLAHYESTRKGLSGREVKRRQELYPSNHISKVKKRTWIGIFIGQFRDILILILLLAAIISIFVNGQFQEAIMILLILVLNAYFATTQEFKAEKAKLALQSMKTHTADVLRDERRQEIKVEELVIGDIILLASGTVIPADCRLIEGRNLKVVEAPLTGLSEEVRKYPEVIHLKGTPTSEQSNMLFRGTYVSSGRGRAMIVATGKKTELGRIAGLVMDRDTELTPSQLKLQQLGSRLAYIIIAISFLVALLGLVSKGDFSTGAIGDMVLLGVSISVAAIPEGLTIVVTLAMAVGVQKMAKRKVIVRKLGAVESLGAASVICTDKTGTLTQNKMAVRKIATFENGTFRDTNPDKFDPGENEVLSHLYLSAILCNNALIDGKREVGEPTEVALLRVAEQINWNLNKTSKQYLKIDEIPFDSERKRMTTVHENAEKGQIISYSKGAPDILIDLCEFYHSKDGLKPITEDIRKQVKESINSMADRAFRVLGFAYKPMEKTMRVWNILEMEKNLVFVGLMGLIDPPREEVTDSIEKCQAAGIKTVMVTGDHRRTAAAIGMELNIADNLDQVITGDELDGLSTPDLVESLDNYRIFARINPAHKLRIMQAYRSKKQIVAMTGDGANDAPALNAANIGISMGITGTDLSKKTADIVLADDNFASIVAAIEEGRVVYQSMSKFLRYMLSSNSAEILVITIAILLGLPPPLVPIQILWMNLITDGLPALALGFDPPEPGLMDKNPREYDKSILSKDKFILIGRVALYMTLISVGVYAYNMDYQFGNGYNTDPELYLRTSTLTFATLSLIQLFNSFATRNLYQSIMGRELLANRALFFANLISGLTLGLVVQGDQFFSQILGTEISIFRDLFHVTPLQLSDWIVVIALSASILLFEEFFKFFRRKKAKNHNRSKEI